MLKTIKTIVGLGSLIFASTTYASLIGDTVGCSLNALSGFTCSAPTAVVGTGLEFTVGGGAFIDVDISASAIDLTFNVTGSLSGTIINLTDLDFPLAPGFITSATLLGTNAITGFTQANLSTSSNSIAIDLIGTDFTQGATASILLNTTQSVPEPAVSLLLTLGLFGFACRRHQLAA